jgi:hypothetical protein
MTRPEPTGVRLVLSNCAEPGREPELDNWYNDYAADCTRPGLLVNVVRYRNCMPGANPRYAAVYDTVDARVERVWPETQHHPDRKVHERSPLLDVVLKATYRRIPPLIPVNGAPLPRAIALVLSDYPDSAPSDEVSHCADNRIRSVVESHGAARASRYGIVDGEPNPPQFLEIYESMAIQRLLELDQAMRPSSAVVRYCGVFERIFAYTST